MHEAFCSSNGTAWGTGWLALAFKHFQVQAAFHEHGARQRQQWEHGEGIEGGTFFFCLILDHIFIQTFRFLVIPLDVQL